MSKANSIEASEIFSILSDTINGANFDDLCDATHMIVRIAGYRKQNAGEWRVDDFTGIIKCNLCDNDAPISTVSGEQYEPEYCPNCGAKMKGGE